MAGGDAETRASVDRRARKCGSGSRSMWPTPAAANMKSAAATPKRMERRLVIGVLHSRPVGQGHGVRTTDDGRRTTDDGRRATGDGRRATGDGRWAMGDGRWAMGDGRSLRRGQDSPQGV